MTFLVPGGIILLAKVWAIGYVLVILGVTLGLTVVARPSGRKHWKT
jgi:hypothetical protein